MRVIYCFINGKLKPYPSDEPHAGVDACCSLDNNIYFFADLTTEGV